MSLPFCPRCQRFLPDRYVEGLCPFCSAPARGDQCDHCGKPLNATELKEPHCKFCNTTPQIKESEHFFLKLEAFQDKLQQWVKQQTHWRPNVLNFTLGLLDEGLRSRAITRDMEWGVSVPVDGWEKKRIYVWFEAVIGYLSASKEWALSQGDAEAWRPFWQAGTKSYYCIGKDNIPFHTIIWPSMLMGYGGLNLPYDVPANEFLTLEGKQLSTSRNWAVWLPDYLERFEPDPLRYYMSINMPETGDADFSWQEFYRRNNDELVATYGNLVHRVLTFTYRNFDGAVPQPGELDASSQALLAKAQTTFTQVGDMISRCRFREAIRTAFSLAQDANRYLDDQSPWKKIKVDRQAAATALYVAISAISSLKTILYPFLPFSSQKLHHLLGYQGNLVEWKLETPGAGQKLATPEPLFIKLEDKAKVKDTSKS